MIYRNGIKEYLTTTLLFGVMMGVLLAISAQSLLVGMVLGIFSGCFFSLLIFLFCKFQEKKFDKMRIEIAKKRKIICDGGATVQGTGGWMFFTEYGIEFYPHKINFSQEELTIPINMIKTVKTNKNQIILDTIDNLTFAIVVSRNKEWKKQIENNLISSTEE